MGVYVPVFGLHSWVDAAWGWASNDVFRDTEVEGRGVSGNVVERGEEVSGSE